MTNGILLNGSADIDFMIHGVFPYQFFGQTVWITTTHICLLIVLLLILAFAIAANRAMKHASEVPGFFQNIVELVVEKLDGMNLNFKGYQSVFIAVMSLVSGTSYEEAEQRFQNAGA